MTALLNSVRPVRPTARTYAVRFLVQAGSREILLPVSEIDWIEADTYYSRLHANGKQYMIRETITELASKLNPQDFVRVHRSAVVNLSRVREIHREGRSESSLVMMSGNVVKMSRQGRQRLLELGR